MLLELYVTYRLCLKTVVSFLNTVDVYTTAIINMHFVLCLCQYENFMFKKNHKQQSC